MGLFASKSKPPPGPSEAELRFSALLRSQAFIEFSLDGTILEANDNFCRAMGYALEEIAGRHHSMVVDQAEAAGQDYRDFWRKLNGGEFVATKPPWSNRPAPRPCIFKAARSSWMRRSRGSSSASPSAAPPRLPTQAATPPRPTPVHQAQDRLRGAG